MKCLGRLSLLLVFLFSPLLVIGQTVNSVPGDGFGKYVYSDNTVYEGEWKGGLFDGKGKIIYPNGASYEGEWMAGKMNGQGTYRWTSGNQYSGSFVNGAREGYGVYTWASGDRYEGEWKAGHKAGQGTYTYADGVKESGMWEADELVTPDSATLAQRSSAAQPTTVAVAVQTEQLQAMTFSRAVSLYENQLLSLSDAKTPIMWLPQNASFIAVSYNPSSSYTKVIYTDKNIEGYVQTSALARISEVHPSATSMLVHSGESATAACCDVTLENVSKRMVFVKFGKHEYRIKPNSKMALTNILSGEYLVRAYSAGRDAVIGKESLEAGAKYVWTYK